jgi:tetraacyldisaccharide 4'-kinase
VSLREPPWWYGARYAPVGKSLQPLSAIYASVVERRMARAPRYKSPLPVICVGNFTAGGTGKTPCVRMIAEVLQARGEKPAVLSRGYGGSTRGPHWVSLARDRAAQVGDEPLLLAAHLPVMVSRDRAAGARAIVEARQGATIIIMDDGLQSPQLAKDLRLAVVDGARGFGNGQTLPSGPLRARLATQLVHVDAIIVNHGALDPSLSAIAAELRQTFTGPVLDATLAVNAAEAWAGRSVVAFAGIGVPERFFASLKACGANIRARRTFPDHHPFSEADAAQLLALARQHNAALVTTEKDKARMLQATGALADLDRATSTLSILMQVTPRDQLRLEALLAGTLAGMHSRSSAGIVAGMQVKSFVNPGAGS